MYCSNVNKKSEGRLVCTLFTKTLRDVVFPSFSRLYKASGYMHKPSCYARDLDERVSHIGSLPKVLQVRHDLPSGMQKSSLGTISRHHKALYCPQSSSQVCFPSVAQAFAGGRPGRALYVSLLPMPAIFFCLSAE
jgi:hypothetical protein